MTMNNTDEKVLPQKLDLFEDAGKALNTENEIVGILETLSATIQQLEALKGHAGFMKDSENFMRILEKASSAISNGYTSLNDAAEILENEVDRKLSSVKEKPKEYKYITASISRKYFKREGMYSYLFQFPRRIVKHKENCIWFSKRFCTSHKNTVDIRYRKNTKFRFFYEYIPEKTRILTADEFESLVMDADLYLQSR